MLQIDRVMRIVENDSSTEVKAFIQWFETREGWNIGDCTEYLIEKKWFDWESGSGVSNMRNFKVSKQITMIRTVNVQAETTSNAAEQARKLFIGYVAQFEQDPHVIVIDVVDTISEI